MNLGALVRLFAPGGAKARHQTLIFHRVLAQPDPMLPDEPTTDAFDRLIRLLKANFEVVPLADAIALSAQGKLPAASVSITFDDGYADNFTQALPVLESHNVPATFFIATGYLDGGRMWNDTIIETARRLADGETPLGGEGAGSIQISDVQSRIALAESTIQSYKYRPFAEREKAAKAFATLQNSPLPDDLMMTRKQVQQMSESACAEVGAHTLTHPILANLDLNQMRDEVAGSMDALTAITGIKPRLFAYPNGKAGKDYLPEQVAVLDELGLEGAVATDWGVMERGTDRFQIPRFTPWSRGSARFLIDMLRARRGWI